MAPTPTDPPRVHVLEVVGNAIVGGMETSVQRLVERLPRERFAVTAVCPFESRFTDTLRGLGVEVLIAAMPEDLSWTSLQLVCALVHANAVDVLHAHLPNGHLLAGVAGRVTGKPVLATIHARQLVTLDLEVHRATGTHLSVVCRHSHFHALGLGVNAAQLSCIPNGVDTAQFAPRPAARMGALRRRFGIGPDTPLVGFVGRFSPEKGPDLFLRAALLLHGTHPEARCVMVGDGPLHGELAEFIARFGLDGVVHLAGTCSDMPAVCNELDLLVSSSHSEALPLAVMEAMASGLPVVATKAGGLADLVEQGRTGWLVGLRDFEGLAGQVAHILRTPGELQRMGRHARERAVQRFSLAETVDATAQLLQRLAAGGRGEPGRARISAVHSSAAQRGKNGAAG